jgi:hypothetical protein
MKKFTAQSTWQSDAPIPQTGGVNQSRIHWDMICDMRSGGQIFADDALFYQDGEFLI